MQWRLYLRLIRKTISLCDINDTYRIGDEAFISFVSYSLLQGFDGSAENPVKNTENFINTIFNWRSYRHCSLESEDLYKIIIDLNCNDTKARIMLHCILNISAFISVSMITMFRIRLWFLRFLWKRQRKKFDQKYVCEREREKRTENHVVVSFCKFANLWPSVSVDIVVGLHASHALGSLAFCEISRVCGHFWPRPAS